MNNDEEKVLAGLEDEWEDAMPEQRLLDEKQARRLIRRTRWKLVLGTVQIFFMISFVFWLFQMAVDIGYSNTKNSHEFNRFVDTYIETRHAGVRFEKRPYPAAVNSLLTQSTQQRLYSQVGTRQAIIGEVKAKKPLFGNYQIMLDLHESYLNENNFFSFNIPLNLIDPQSHPRGADPQSSEHVWKQTRHIGDGFVAEMAFSTQRGIDPVDLQKRLSVYDLHLLHMPVYSGELRTITEGLSKVESGGFVSTNTLMLRPKVDYGEGAGPGYGYGYEMWFSGKESVENGIAALLRDLDWLQEQGDYYEAELDRQRIAYLKENGVQVFGAVVTGPIRELEKLQQEKDFGYFQLGRVEVWRWGQ